MLPGKHLRIVGALRTLAGLGVGEGDWLLYGQYNFIGLHYYAHHHWVLQQLASTGKAK